MVTFSTREHRQLTPPERDLVLQSILYAHEHRQYELYAACVMPDHVHLLFEPQIKEQDSEGKPVFWSVSDILQGIKSASAHNINKTLSQQGHVWEQESMDRIIRGQADLEEKFHYICRNPWDSGVAVLTGDYAWLWTSGHAGPRAVARVGAVDEASTAAREARALPGTNPETDAQQFQVDIAFRVIADHIRTLSFAIADGIQPGNNDRNYVLRRILRRAVRYGRTLGFKEPFFYKLVDVLAETMGDVFPEIRAKKKHVQEVIRIEEESFNKTLDRGIELFDEAVGEHRVKSEVHREAMKDLPNHSDLGRSSAYSHLEDEGKSIQAIDSNGNILAAFAFKLYDTYGFPLDLTELMARERGLTVDTKGFEKLMDEQRKRSQAAIKRTVIKALDFQTDVSTQFVGYETAQTEAKILQVVEQDTHVLVITDRSPFYAAMGGQVGDAGFLRLGARIFTVDEVTKIGHAVAHVVPKLFLDEYDGSSTEVELAISEPRRHAIERHHTVTHLLHWALHRWPAGRRRKKVPRWGRTS